MIKKKPKNWKKNSASLTIKDNASGIKCDDLPTALSPAGKMSTKEGSLHEHSMGLKQALVTIGTKEKYNEFGEIECIEGFDIYTKCKDEEFALKISSLSFDDIPIEDVKKIFHQVPEQK